MKIETDKAKPDHSPIFSDITTQVIAIHIEATLGHNTGIDIATTGAVHHNSAQPTEDAATSLVMTHHADHIRDHPNIKAPQVIDPEIAVGHIHEHPTDPQGMNHTDQAHTTVGQDEGHILRRMWK